MNSPTQASFKIDTKELKAAFDHIKRLGGRFRKDEVLKIRILNDSIEISRDGMMRRLGAETDGMADVNLSIKLFQSFLESSNVPMIKYLFRSGELECGTSIYSSGSISIKPLFTDHDRGLPINTTDRDLIRLGYMKNVEELNDQGLTNAIQSALNRMKNKILEASEILKAYGVKYEDLEELIKERHKSS